jgi:hypothetical protein
MLPQIVDQRVAAYDVACECGGDCGAVDWIRSVRREREGEHPPSNLDGFIIQVAATEAAGDFSGRQTLFEQPPGGSH